VGNWRQSNDVRKVEKSTDNAATKKNPAAFVSHLNREKEKKSSDDAATNGDLGASVLLGDVAWLDNVENEGQRGTAVGNFRQSP